MFGQKACISLFFFSISEKEAFLSHSVNTKSKCKIDQTAIFFDPVLTLSISLSHSPLPRSDETTWPIYKLRSSNKTAATLKRLNLASIEAAVKPENQPNEFEHRLLGKRGHAHRHITGDLRLTIWVRSARDINRAIGRIFFDIRMPSFTKNFQSDPSRGSVTNDHGKHTIDT